MARFPRSEYSRKFFTAHAGIYIYIILCGNGQSHSELNESHPGVSDWLTSIITFILGHSVRTLKNTDNTSLLRKTAVVAKGNIKLPFTLGLLSLWNEKNRNQKWYQ